MCSNFQTNFWPSQFLKVLNYDAIQRVGGRGISGTLTAVDQFLNLKLEGVAVNEDKCPRPEPSPLGPSKTTPVPYTVYIVFFFLQIFFSGFRVRKITNL